MPKEMIRGTTVLFEDDESLRETPVVDVRWDRESGYFQIVTRAQEAEVCLPEEEIPVRFGYWVTLDRRGTNDLIRALRRARDQAFGRDE
jgi:hypothetical protein